MKQFEKMNNNFWNKTIRLEQSIVGTTDVMKWCDEHPDESLHHTLFTAELDKRGLMASSIDERELDLTLEFHPYEEWHQPLAGWRRIGFNCGGQLWYCKKIGENKLICITD